MKLVDIAEQSLAKGLLKGAGTEKNIASKAQKAAAQNKLGSIAITRQQLVDSINDVLSHAATHSKPIGTYKNADEVINAIKSGGMQAEHWQQLYSGFLKSSKTPIGFIDDLARDLVGNHVFIGKYANKFDKPADLLVQLKANGYSDDAANAIIKNIGADNKLFYGGVKPGTGNAGNPPPPNTKTNAAQHIKNFVIGRYNGVMLKYILGGVAAGTAVNIIQNNIVGTIGKLSDSDTRQIRKDIEKLKQFPPAVMNLVNIITEYGVDRKTNIAWVYIPKTGVKEYDDAGGVYLYSNGIIKTKNGRKTGKYTGAGGLQESLSMITILEQSNELEVPEERLNRLIKRTIYYLDFPSTNNSLLQVEKILTYLLGKTYKGEPVGPVFLERYKKSGQWTSNFIPADIEKSINRILTYQPETRATSERLIALVDRLQNDTPTNNTFAFEDNITITWDDGTNSYDRGANQPVDEPAADANQQNEPAADAQQQQPTPDVVDNSSEVKITGYTQCNGTYKIGCFNMEKIVQLNDCLGLGGGNPYFTQKTQNALDTLLQTRKSELTDADIDSICANKAYYKYADRIYIKDGSYLIKQGAEFNNEELTEIDGYFSGKNFARIEMNGLLYGWKPAQ